MRDVSSLAGKVSIGHGGARLLSIKFLTLLTSNLTLSVHKDVTLQIDPPLTLRFCFRRIPLWQAM